MKKYKEVFLWAFLGLAMLLAASWQLVSLPDAQDRLDALPPSGKHYTSKSLSISKEEHTYFQKCNMLKRIYTIGKHQVFISIVDGTRNRNAVHDPSVCFTGGGWKIKEKTLLTTNTGSVDILKLRKGPLYQEVLVCFSEKGKTYGSATTYWMRSALRRLTYGVSGPEPVRIVIQPMLPNQEIDWTQLLKDFPELLQI